MFSLIFSCFKSPFFLLPQYSPLSSSSVVFAILQLLHPFQQPIFYIPSPSIHSLQCSFTKKSRGSQGDIVSLCKCHFVSSEGRERKQRGKVKGEEFTLRDATPSFALSGWEEWRRRIGTEKPERKRQRGLMVSDILGDSSKICLHAEEVILRKRDSYARQTRSERGREKKISAVGEKSNCETVRRQKNRSKSAWESLRVWWILIGQCLQRHANEKVGVLWVNAKSLCDGVALPRKRMINTTKALNHKTLISHEQTFRHSAPAEHLNDWWSAVIRQNGKPPVTSCEL